MYVEDKYAYIPIDINYSTTKTTAWTTQDTISRISNPITVTQENQKTQIETQSEIIQKLMNQVLSLTAAVEQLQQTVTANQQYPSQQQHNKINKTKKQTQTQTIHPSTPQ